MVTIIQTTTERHIENVLFGGFGPRSRMTLCGVWYAHEAQLNRDIHFVEVGRIPTAAVCPTCVEVARRWYASNYFVPFDAVQRRRLLDNLDRDLAAA